MGPHFIIDDRHHALFNTQKRVPGGGIDTGRDIAEHRRQLLIVAFQHERDIERVRSHEEGFVSRDEAIGAPIVQRTIDHHVVFDGESKVGETV